MNYYIQEREWKPLFAFLRTRRGIRTGNEPKLRRFIEGIWYICRSGCQWRLLPSWYGSWRAVHQRFKEWSHKGVWEALFKKIQHCPDGEFMMIDATIVRAHACSAGHGKNTQDIQALWRSKGRFTTKIHALVDALGNPLKFILTHGQHHEITQAPALIQDMKNTWVIAGKGYDSNAFVEELEKKGCMLVIPSKRNRKHPRNYDEYIYKERHLIECFFGKMKHFRRIFSRFDKTAQSFMAFLNFVATLIWLR